MQSASNSVMLVAAVAGVLAVGALGWRAVRTQPTPATATQSSLSKPVPTVPLATTPPPLADGTHVAPGKGTAPPQQQIAKVAPDVSKPFEGAGPEAKVPADTAARPAGAKPSFDVVRVEPSGAAIVAGRAAPHATVTILNKGIKLSEVTADQTGAFAAIPPALPPGDHLLTLRVSGSDGEVDSEQSVTISVPSQPGARVVAALTDPDQPTRVLSDSAKPIAGGPQVTIRTVEAGQEGAFFASGAAPAGSAVRLYLNGSFVADVRAAADSSWSLRVEKGMTPGHYDVRADLLEADSAQVAGRAAVPFDYPAQVAAKAPGSETAPSAAAGRPVVASPVPPPNGAPAGPDTPSGVAVVKEIQSVTVQRGDSLWRISRRVLGKGIRYTQIYEANATQIRDPNKIFPGQVLVAPSKLD
jgi:nucleoid-associated protein YgaU